MFSLCSLASSPVKVATFTYVLLLQTFALKCKGEPGLSASLVPLLGPLNLSPLEPGCLNGRTASPEPQQRAGQQPVMTLMLSSPLSELSLS